MYSLLTVTFTAILLVLVFTPLCRDAFLRLGIVDHPDGARKLHRRPIPRVGGIAVAIAYLGALAAVFLSPLSGGAIIGHQAHLAWRFLPPVGLIFTTGLIDDLIGLKPWQKFLGQFAAAAWAYSVGVRINSISGHSLADWLAASVTVLWLVACTNALNLIDGLDGLAAGIGFLGSVTTLIAALLQGNFGLALVTAPLAGALLGFLRYNYNPASIFLGDCGSLTIGFLLGSFAVLWSQKAATLLGMTAPAIALAVPILDTTLAIVRRFLRRQPIFSPDRGHIHHRLLDRGLTQRRAVLLMYAACVCAAALSLIQSFADGRYSALVILLFWGLVALAIQQLGYAEFQVARRLIAKGAFRDHLNAHIALRNLERALADAEDPPSCWKAVQRACRQFGFNRVELYLDGLRFAEEHEPEHPDTWMVRVPLSGADYIEVRRPFDCKAPVAIAPLADCLRRHITVKTQNTLTPRSDDLFELVEREN